MKFLTSGLVFLLLLGCSNKLLYIENDNYSKSYTYYLNNLDLKNKNYKLIAIFNDETSLENAKKRISLFKNRILNKFEFYTIIIYPYEKANSQTFTQIFEYLSNLNNFLIKTKKYKNNMYTMAIPQANLDLYQVLIFIKKI